MFERLAAPAPDAHSRAELLHEAAILWRDRLIDESKAGEMFAAAVAADATFAPASVNYGMFLASQSRFGEAFEFLDGRVDIQSPETPLLQLTALLQCFRYQGALGEAIDIAGLVLAQDPQSLVMLQARAEMLEEAARWQDAEEAWQAYLDCLGESAAANAVASVRQRIGQMARRRGDVLFAVQQLEMAYSLEPESLSILSDLRQVYEVSERWLEAAELRGREAAAATDTAVQLDHYMALFAMYDDKIGDSSRAISMLEKAADVSPRDPELLRRLLSRYEPQEDRAKFLLAAERLLGLVPEAEIEAAFFSQLAAAYESVDPGRAKEFYGKALARDPESSSPELREKHRELALASGDYAAYVPSEEQAIVKLADPEQKAARYAALAEVYLVQLADMEKGIAALTKACASAPADERMWRRLADAYALDPQTYGKAVELYKRLLAASSLDADMVRIIARLEGQLGNIDRAYGYYACLLCLLPADEEAVRFVTPCRAGRPTLAGRAPTDAERSQGLLHPHQGGPIEDLFAPLARFAELTQPGDLAKRGITDRDKMAPDEPQIPLITKLLELLGAAQAQPYVRSGAATCEMELLGPPALLIGEALLAESGQRRLAFLVARSAELYRSGHTLCERLQTPDLAALVAALCCAVDPNSTPPGAKAETTRWAQVMSGPMTVQIRAAMAPRVAAYLKAAGGVDMNRWRNACIATANRIGLLLTCDIDEAVTALLHARGFDDMGGAPRAPVLKEAHEELDLFRFAQSDAFFTLRSALGLALRRKATAPAPSAAPAASEPEAS